MSICNFVNDPREGRGPDLELLVGTAAPPFGELNVCRAQRERVVNQALRNRVATAFHGLEAFLESISELLCDKFVNGCRHSSQEMLAVD